LLKWEYQPGRRSASWSKTIVVQRKGIQKLLKNNPSFGPTLPDVVPEAHVDAVAFVAAVLKRPKSDFPAVCPYTLEQLLDEEFLPEPASDGGAL